MFCKNVDFDLIYNLECGSKKKTVSEQSIKKTVPREGWETLEHNVLRTGPSRSFTMVDIARPRRILTHRALQRPLTLIRIETLHFFQIIFDSKTSPRFPNIRA